GRSQTVPDGPPPAQRGAGGVVKVAGTGKKAAGGSGTRKSPNGARGGRTRRGGRKVRPSGNGALGSRRGSRSGGEPSQEAETRAASRGADGAIERTPTREPSPSVVPAGTTALFPMNARRPRRVGATVIH